MPISSEIIVVSPDKCVGCNACVRNCPAKEANITKMLEDGRFVTTVNPDRCISCGECVRTCQHGARSYNDDTEEFMRFIERNKAAILVAPAIKTVMPTMWKGVLDYFRQKGVQIFDISLGADICTWAHLRAIETGKVRNIVTQPCAAIVNYIETYQPKLINNLSPVHSPASCEAVYLQRYLHVTVPLAMLSPCIAKKTEFVETGLIKYNVTMAKVKEYFKSHRINIPENAADDDYKYPFDDQQGLVGAVYPRPGGLRDNLWIHNPELNITNSEGVHKVYPELDMYADMPEFKHPEVFDVLSCEYGCNVGPATDTSATVFDIMATMRDVEKFARKNRKAGLFGKGEDKQFKKFDDVLTLAHFLRTYNPRKPTPVPSADQLEPIFKSMGKLKETDRHYDCHACGYHSCYEMATAIYRGLNVPDNCIIHAKSVLNARHSELTEEHNKLFMMADKCKYFSDQLVQDIETISANITAINEATAKTGEKSKIVNSLMENLIAFCSAYDHMDAQTVTQLTGILGSISTAFKSLDENVTITMGGSDAISESAVEITRLVEELNVMLHETTHVDKY